MVQPIRPYKIENIQSWIHDFNNEFDYLFHITFLIVSVEDITQNVNVLDTEDFTIYNYIHNRILVLYDVVVKFFIICLIKDHRVEIIIKPIEPITISFFS